MRQRRIRLLSQVLVEGARIVWWTLFYLIRAAAATTAGRSTAEVTGRGTAIDRSTAAANGRAGDDRWTRLARLTRGYLLHMGPLYIKAGQVFGTQSGMLPQGATDEFRAFFCDLPPMRTAVLRRVLRRALGVPVATVFARFDWEPVAVGSVAQVHRAVLGDGTEVAVKVVKRGVRERLRAAAWVLERLLACAHLLVPAVRRYDVRSHFSALRPLLTGQCDMNAEALRQEEIGLNFRHHPFVSVPRVHHELCGADVLVMEYVAGVPGPHPERADISRPELAARLLDVFNSMVYFHGLFHVDPHPGNIMFRAGGQIVLLDFGLVGELSEEDKWNLSSFYYACVRREWTLAAQRFTRTFVVHPRRLDADPTGYRRQLEAILRNHFDEVSSHFSTMGFLGDAARLLNRFGTMVSTRFSLLALSTVTGEGFLSRVDPAMDIWHNGRQFTDRYSPYLSDELRTRFDNELGDQIRLSRNARREAAGYLVAPTHFDRFVLPSAFPLVVSGARGSKIYDLDGNEYIDLSGGYGPHLLGYGNPVAARAIHEAVDAGGVNALGSPAELVLARHITQAFGPHATVVLANSGTEAVQMALRMARAYTGRQRVAKFEGHYHGFSDQGLVSSWFRYSGRSGVPRPIGNCAGMQQRVVDDTLVLQYGDRASLDRIAAHADTLACVILEPMQSVLADFDAEFLRELSKVCARARVLVVYDEVVTGFRVHYGGVQHLVGVRPDLTCLGKIIGGGLPCGAVVGRPEVVGVARTTGDPFLDVESRAFVGGTMSGNSVTAAAGAAVLAHLRDNPGIYDELQRKTNWLTGEFRAHAAAYQLPCEVRGQRSLLTVTFDHARPVRVRDRLAGSHTKANIALACYMRRYGVYLPELHTLMLSDAHSDADLKCVSQAFANSLGDMTSAGFFTT